MTLGSRRPFRCTRGLWVIMRSSKSSQELGEMITVWLSVPGLQVSIRPDPFVEWEPQVIAAPTIAAKYQPLAEEVAADLRRAYELCA
jgi:hypothetical protein